MKKRNDGRFSRNFTINGQRVYIYADSQEELDTKYIETKTKINKGMLLKDTTILGDLAMEWYEIYIKDNPDKSQSTQDVYKSIINNHIFVFENTLVKDIKPIMIDKYLKSMESSKSLKHKIIITFKQILDTAVSNKIIENNPALQVKKIEMDERHGKALTTSERITVLNALEDDPGYLWVYFLLNTGLREREALALLWTDFNADEASLSITKALEFKNSQPIIKEPKTKAGIRVVPLPGSLVLALQEERKNNGSLYIFHNKNGKIHSKTTATRMWNNVKRTLTRYQDKEEKKTAPKISLNYRILRHTYATALFDAEIDVKSAQEILGHSDFKITMDIYTHIQEERRTQTSIKLNNLYMLPVKTKIKKPKKHA